MTELEVLAARIVRIEDHLELRALVARYARAMDERDIETLGTLFTRDARLMTRDGAMNVDGRDAIVAELGERLRQLGPTNHFCHDHLLAFDAGDADHATGTLNAHAEISLGARAMLASIRYEDSYRRTEHRWYFASRTASYFYFFPAAEYSEAMAGSQRMRIRGEPRRADYPESLDSWRAFYDKPP